MTNVETIEPMWMAFQRLWQAGQDEVQARRAKEQAEKEKIKFVQVKFNRAVRRARKQYERTRGVKFLCVNCSLSFVGPTLGRCMCPVEKPGKGARRGPGKNSSMRYLPQELRQHLA